MTKHIKLTAVFTLLLSSALIAQDAPKETPAPADAPAKKTCHMSDYCAKMKEPPKKGFHHSIEWGGIYGGPANQVSYRMFGHTINADMRDRDAIRMNAGYQFNPYLYVGGGVGAEFQYQAYTNPSPGGIDVDYHYTGKFVAVPIYAEIKGYLLKKPISPFLQLRIGYAPDIYVLGNNHPTTVENCSYNNISVGVRIYSHLSITAGYLFMYQPESITGYDLLMQKVIVDKSSPYQNRFTVGIAIGM
jgi:opacity protein-like surface antigen